MADKSPLWLINHLCFLQTDLQPETACGSDESVGDCLNVVDCMCARSTQSSEKRRSLISTLEVPVFDLSCQRINMFPSVLYTTPLSELWMLCEQWCGFDGSHTDVCIKGHVSYKPVAHKFF